MKARLDYKIAILILTLTIFATSAFFTPVGAGEYFIRVPEDYSTIQEAVNMVEAGGVILVSEGEYSGADINKPVTIIGEEGAVIVEGDPVWSTGINIWQGGSGSIISHLTFRGGEDMSYGVWGGLADDVTISHNKFYDLMKHVDIRWCNNWRICYNTMDGFQIPAEGSGSLHLHGILLLHSSYNYIARNTIMAELSDPGGFEDFKVAGIALGILTPVGEVTRNKVVANTIQLVEQDGSGFTGGIVLADYYALSQMYDNLIVSNNLQGCADPLFVDPPALEDFNLIKANRISDTV